MSDVVTGSTPSKKHAEYYGGDFPFFKPADLEAGDNVVEATEYLSEEGKNVSRIIPKLSTAVCCMNCLRILKQNGCKSISRRIKILLQKCIG